MCICMIFTLLPFSALADNAGNGNGGANTGESTGAPVTEPNTQPTVVTGHAKIGDTDYPTLDAALEAAKDDDTIYLGAGEYSVYGSKTVNDKNLTLTFIGAGADKTIWKMGTSESGKNGEDGDYSLQGNNKVTFENMTLRSSVTPSGKMVTRDFTGFIRIDHIVVNNCVVEGRTTYWGYENTEFHNTKFYAPGHEALNELLADSKNRTDYALWTGSGKEYTFDKCKFYGNGKYIHAYRDYVSALEVTDGVLEITINFNDCTVYSTGADKQIINIKDNNSPKKASAPNVPEIDCTVKWVLNISGNNTIDYSAANAANETQVNKYTCSRLFQVEGIADGYNLSNGNGNGKRCLATVNIDGTPVWKDGKMVSHAIDTANDKYTDGYKDDAFTVEENGNTVTKTCKYCGWKEDYTKQDWNINVSKTATELKKDANGDYKTNVTLSVPGVEESLATDVVFVLDKSTSADLENQAIAMLNELKEQAVNTGAKVKVGVVIFNKIANVTKLTDISTTEGLAKIEAAIKQEIKSGTNTHAGLLAGKELLDNDTGVAANRKHLIFVSDGVTYLFCKDGDYTKAYTRNFNASLLEGVGQGGALSELDMQYGGTYMSGSVPKGSIEAWLSDITSRIGTDKDNKNFDYEYTGQNAPETQQMPSKDCVSNVEKALYLTQQTYLAAQKEGYNCYSVLAKNTYKFGTDFMDMLVGGKTLSFGDIKDDILYAVGKGSYVKDVIGDKFELFDLEPDHNGFSSLKLYVGDKELTNRFISANVENGDFTVYYFADNFDTNTLLNEETHSVDEVILEQSYRFKVDYNVEQKLFTWTFGEAVSNFEPVQLSYTLQLTQPATAPGTYGQLDLNGDGYIDGKDTETKVDPNKALYTNKSATLTPVDSDKHQGTPVTFPMPSVEYTVRNPYRPPVNPGIGDEIIVEITGNSDSVVYDGAEHSVKGYTVKISDPRYTEKDFTFTGKAEASGVNAGTYEMGLKAEQFKNTNARFTNVKFVIKADGVLTITPKELTITAGSKTEYGPTPVTCDEWTVSGLAAGDKVESVKITGIQSVPGSSPNVPSDAVIKNAKGEDVTKNYAIKYVNGTLTMLEVLNKEDHFNYIIGTPEGLSLPTANVTRAEVATIFFRLMTDDARAKFDSLDNSFSDVAKGKWYNRAISTLANAGIIKGDPAGTYRPGDPITRAEMAAIIARFGDFKEGGKTFSDISGHWAQKYIELAASNGWINGNPDGTFKPNNNITRAETVAMINRVLNRQTESNDDLLPVSQMTNWSDNMDTAKWYYRDMQEATNNHKAERVGNSIYEKWTEKLPDIDWASYQI